ncbi:protein S100-A7-like [Hemicordylus capensis]|uniref:protein S100-A7-like n=1 Tax=Hemicordylus capensis TaxID=884348 RepID=UPI0023047FFC|nr:protein S100-A7-like [Hemicordylus capensis]
MKTLLEDTCMCVVNIYHQYCILDPVDDYLHPNEFNKLMVEQAQDFLKNTKPGNLDQPAYLQQLFQQADKDKTGYLKFTEFQNVLTPVLKYAHEKAHQLH